MTLLEKSKKLVELRNSISEQEAKLEEILKPLKEEKDLIQAEVLSELKETGQFSARFDFGTIVRAVRKTLKVNNESSVIEWLKGKGLENEYTAVRLTDSFDALAKELVKKNELPNGAEIRETEYISITQPSSKEDKRKLVTN